jgi:hypothetical protein
MENVSKLCSQTTDVSISSSFHQYNNSINIVSNNDRTIIHDTDTSNNHLVEKENIYTSEKDNENKYPINIFRYKFSNKINDLLYNFSKIHQYDDRNTFKEAWQLWLEENNECIDLEIRRLREINYSGDIIEKMFKSARYYFRKKNPAGKEQKNRREYIGVNKELLEVIDNHISKNLLTETIKKPSNSFNNFCIVYEDLYNNEITRLTELEIFNTDKDTDIENIKNKIKKTYKNRYFNIQKKKTINPN